MRPQRTRFTFPEPEPDVADLSMRVLTVKEPWATLILKYGKNIENRSRNIAGYYRGPIAIHSALRALPPRDPAWQVAAEAGMPLGRGERDRGRIIGVVDLVDVTPWTPLIEDEAEGSSPGARVLRTPIGWEMQDHWHLHLDNPHALDRPIPYAGSIALRRLDTATAAKVITQLTEAGATTRMLAHMADTAEARISPRAVGAGGVPRDGS